jgi:hypothetical protein
MNGADFADPVDTSDYGTGDGTMTALLRAAVAVGFAALVAGPAHASDTAVTLAQPQTMDQLVRMSSAELHALFAAAPAAPAPGGFVPGRAIKNPGSRNTVANSRRTGLVWKGKIFRDDGTMINRFGPVKAIPADVYEGTSWYDGRPALVLDYSRSRLWPTVRDEVREVAPGLYLGIMYRDGAPTNPPMFFALDARK